MGNTSTTSPGPSNSQLNVDELEDFQVTAPRVRKGCARKGAKGHATKRRKIPEYSWKVLAVNPKQESTPVAAQRKSAVTLHISRDAGEGEVRDLLHEALDIPADQLQFMYAYGRMMRLATLRDVSGATEWDAESVHAFKGEGYLYVCWMKEEEEDKQPNPVAAAATETNVSY